MKIDLDEFTAYITRVTEARVTQAETLGSIARQLQEIHGRIESLSNVADEHTDEIVRGHERITELEEVLKAQIRTSKLMRDIENE